VVQIKRQERQSPSQTVASCLTRSVGPRKLMVAARERRQIRSGNFQLRTAIESQEEAGTATQRQFDRRSLRAQARPRGEGRSRSRRGAYEGYGPAAWRITLVEAVHADKPPTAHRATLRLKLRQERRRNLLGETPGCVGYLFEQQALWCGSTRAIGRRGAAGEACWTKGGLPPGKGRPVMSSIARGACVFADANGPGACRRPEGRGCLWPFGAPAGSRRQSLPHLEAATPLRGPASDLLDALEDLR